MAIPRVHGLESRQLSTKSAWSRTGTRRSTPSRPTNVQPVPPNASISNTIVHKKNLVGILNCLKMLISSITHSKQLNYFGLTESPLIDLIDRESVLLSS